MRARDANQTRKNNYILDVSMRADILFILRKHAGHDKHVTHKSLHKWMNNLLNKDIFSHIVIVTKQSLQITSISNYEYNAINSLN